MKTAPRPENEIERLEALHAYRVLQTAPEPGFDRITALASRTLGLPMAYVTLIGENTQWFKSCYPTSAIVETPREVAFCAHAILSGDVFVVPDASLDERFHDNPMVLGPPHIRFYMGCPLLTPSGHRIGSLCAIDTKPRVATPEMLATIIDLAAMVVDQLELQRWVIEEDARQRRDAETNYQRLADAINGMVFRVRLTSPQTSEYLYVGPGSVGLLGLLPSEFATNPRLLRERVYPEDFPSFEESSKTVWETGTPWSWTGRIVLEGNVIKWIHGEGRCERQSDGCMLVEGLLVDITEARSRERALYEAKEEAERANVAKTEFLSRMSHELRTPMNAILGFSQMLELEPLGGEAKEDLAQIKKAGEHLLNLINEVLDLSVIEAKRVAMSVESVLVGELIVETINLLRPLMVSSGIRLVAQQPFPVVGVLADRHRLKQIVINLMTNAIKYNRPGGSVAIKLSKEEDTVVLDVSDEGIGISPVQMERLFAPFDRLGVEASGIEGTGLGLAISRGLAEQMGGSLTVRSVVGAGSTFTIRLPENPCLEDTTVTEEIAPAPIPPTIREVFYIEDDEPNILLVQRILGRRPDVRLSTATTISLGLQRLAESVPGAILLDLNLPDGSGETIIQWVRTQSDYRHIPIIVLSADAMPQQVEKILAAGADHYLTKPLNIPAFLEVLDKVMKEPEP